MCWSDGLSDYGVLQQALCQYLSGNFQPQSVMVQDVHKQAKRAAQLGNQTGAGAWSAATSDEEAYREMFRRRVFRLRREGSFRAGLHENEQVLQRFPDSITALCMKSELLLKLGDAEAGLQAADQALRNGTLLKAQCPCTCLEAQCICSCGTKTIRLSAVASQPVSQWPRHEHRSVS